MESKMAKQKNHKIGLKKTVPLLISSRTCPFKMKIGR
jgi:hypothetical protein